jgi:hypothetical protein
VSDDATAAGRPAVRASDADREAVLSRLQSALGEGRIDLDEFGQRADAAYAAVTRADLDLLVADLPVNAPPPVQIVGTRAPEEISSVFGDITMAGTPLVVVHGKTIFGDLRLRSLAPGDSPSRWGALLERLAQRRQLPPPPPPS